MSEIGEWGRDVLEGVIAGVTSRAVREDDGHFGEVRRIHFSFLDQRRVRDPRISGAAKLLLQMDDRGTTQDAGSPHSNNCEGVIKLSPR